MNPGVRGTSTEYTRLSRHADVAVAMDYMLKRWHAFALRLLKTSMIVDGGDEDNGDGPSWLSGNSAE